MLRFQIFINILQEVGHLKNLLYCINIQYYLISLETLKYLSFCGLKGTKRYTKRNSLSVSIGGPASLLHAMWNCLTGKQEKFNLVRPLLSFKFSFSILPFYECWFGIESQENKVKKDFIWRWHWEDSLKVALRRTTKKNNKDLIKKRTKKNRKMRMNKFPNEEN